MVFGAHSEDKQCEGHVGQSKDLNIEDIEDNVELKMKTVCQNHC